MKISFIIEMLLIAILVGFAASAVIDKPSKHKEHGFKSHISEASRKISNNRRQNQNTNQSAPNRFCSCAQWSCNCCRDFAIPVVNIKGPGCATLQYLKGDELAISMSFNDRILANRTIKGRKPQPICMSLPGGVSKFCGRVYNIGREGNEFNACLGLELRALEDIEAAVRVSCFRFGPKGFRLTPAQPLPPIEEDDDDDDDDEDDDDYDFDEEEEEDDPSESLSVLDDDFIGEYFQEGDETTTSSKKKVTTTTRAPLRQATRKSTTKKPVRRITTKPTKKVTATLTTKKVTTTTTTTTTTTEAPKISDNEILSDLMNNTRGQNEVVESNLTKSTNETEGVTQNDAEMMPATDINLVQSESTTQADMVTTPVTKTKPIDPSSSSEENDDASDPLSDVVGDVIEDEIDDSVEEKKGTKAKVTPATKITNKKQNQADDEEESGEMMDEIVDGVAETIGGESEEDDSDDTGDDDDDEDEEESRRFAKHL